MKNEDDCSKGAGGWVDRNVENRVTWSDVAFFLEEKGGGVVKERSGCMYNIYYEGQGEGREGKEKGELGTYIHTYILLLRGIRLG